MTGVVMAPPGRYVVTVRFEHTDGEDAPKGQRWKRGQPKNVVAFDSEGNPLVIGGDRLVVPTDAEYSRDGYRKTGWELDEVELTTVPAAPGWLVDVWWGLDNDMPDRPETLPVIAFEYTPDDDGWGGSFAVGVLQNNRDGDIQLVRVDLTKKNAAVRQASTPRPDPERES